MRLKIKPVASLLALSLIGANAFAQDSGSSSDEISGHLGILLPNQIGGVTEILPVFGFRYAYPLAQSTSIEAGIENTHAVGVDFSALTVDVRGDMSPAANMLAVFYAGLSASWYAPLNSSDRITAWGANVGAALMLKVTDTLWFRGDMKFTANPGTSLYIGFGLAFRLTGSGAS